ncbi:MAG: lysylphosphatidylglycerol synthase transmembrane domain-containing protein [Ilumatobacter sp.]|uniref:lysylphosphatidylglycerol synthase transmembrane domain-containing protein n=1 Tax=Ilumatobacter sp. TaxID=1967498 RepID=UPI002632F2DA|nr:lysylphosphatidylglycerol synthase transmembrane domain-containing protein [Ilumatobacter sp.]MDJ0770286.1 lysylphosphatidylglycerol synthase transmembrane domain-containing protein [Ilumatobacter sp.]
MTLTAAPPAERRAAGRALDRRHVRSSVDVVRLATGSALVVLGIVLANTFDSMLLGLAEDTTANTDRLPDWVRDVAAATLASVVIAGAVSVALWSLLTTRYRRFLLLALGVALAALASIAVGGLVDDIVDEEVRRAFAVDVPLFRVGGGDGRLSPADPLLAAAIAAVTIAGSFLTTAVVRRAGVVVAVYAAVSVLTVGVPPLALLADVGVGLVIGSLVLVIFGRHDLALDEVDVRSGLAAAGLDVATLERTPAISRDGWRASAAAGDELFVAGFGRDEHSSDLVMRATRWLRLRKTGDHRPFTSLRRAVEHEALVWQHAASRGVRAPAIVGVAGAGVDGMVLARQWINGTNASTLPEVPDDVLAAIWLEVRLLQRARIAHGGLRLGNVVIDDEQRPWLVHYGGAELAASEQRLGTDLAELLASTSAAVGADRAIRAAVGVLGREATAQALPWMQPLALTRVTREEIAAAGGVDDLRLRLAEACGLEPEEPVRLERVDTKTVFVLATVVLSAWFLVPQLTDLDSLWSQARDASPEWALAAVCFSIATYLAATASLLGAIPIRLRYGPALAAQVASSFANRVTPAKVGGVATNVRYFQRQGVPTAVSVTAVGLNAVAGVIVHVILTLAFLLLASGGTEAQGLRLPSPAAIGLGLAAILIVVAGAVLVPPTRRLLVTHVVPQLRSGWESLQAVAHNPARLGLLFGGSAAITLFYLAAMIASLEAFGSTASLPAVGLLFLTGTAVANAAPTPGGLGAAEAALIAALNTVEDAEVVVPAVFLYRLVTFWLPILPGWLALTYLRQTDNL